MPAEVRACQRVILVGQHGPVGTAGAHPSGGREGGFVPYVGRFMTETQAGTWGLVNKRAALVGGQVILLPRDIQLVCNPA